MDGLWCYDEERIKQEFVTFYKNLYTDDGLVRGKFCLRHAFPYFGAEWDASLCKAVSC